MPNWVCAHTEVGRSRPGSGNGRGIDRFQVFGTGARGRRYARADRRSPDAVLDPACHWSNRGRTWFLRSTPEALGKRRDLITPPLSATNRGAPRPPATLW
jgi:hypothetical protein